MNSEAQETEISMMTNDGMLTSEEFMTLSRMSTPELIQIIAQLKMDSYNALAICENEWATKYNWLEQAWRNKFETLEMESQKELDILKTFFKELQGQFNSFT